MSSAVALRPIDAPGPSNLGGGLDASTSATENGDSNASNGRKRAISARKRAERFMHEKAPGMSTLVAGHEGSINVGRTGNRLARPKSSKGKRYSSNEVAHLVPDQDGGDELHDPEYQAIKIVERKPSPTDDDSSVSNASSTEDEEENGMEAFSPTRRSFDYSGLRQPSRSYTHHRPHTQPSTSYRTGTLGASGMMSAAGTSGSFGTPSLGNGHISSSANPSSIYLRPPSVMTRSTDRSSSRRTFAEGPATYLAPSITMPPVGVPYGASKAESYNPYTYVPTTTAPSEALSHSRHHQRRHVEFGPSTTYTYDKDTVAPPIAWQSSFTPSAEHSERHRTKIHDESQVSANIKRGIQSLKLDISFGLMRLGKKK